MPSHEDIDFEAIQARMRRLVLRLLGRHQVVEDVVQNAMEAFLRARSSFRGEGSIEAFADRITANVARTWIRRQHTRNRLRDVVETRTDWPELPPGPEEQAETRDRLRRVMEIIERLAPKYRMPFVLHFVERRSVPEISGMLELKEASVRTRLHRARLEVTRRARRDPVLSEWFAELGGGG
jgi:RNA polymerase sigma-70 factor (ECF subfamily)